MGRRFKITQTLQTKLKQKILKCILQKKEGVFEDLSTINCKLRIKQSQSKL